MYVHVIIRLYFTYQSLTPIISPDADYNIQDHLLTNGDNFHSDRSTLHFLSTSLHSWAMCIC